MKWRSHISIGKAIADRLELPPGERKAFLDGLVEPDRHKERIGSQRRSYRVGHHHPSHRTFMLHVWIARRSFLRNDRYQGYRHLGMALHYLQDRSTSKGLLGLTHSRREEALAKLDVPERAIVLGMQGAVSSPRFVSRSLALTKPLKDPREVMVQASFRSAAVAAAVVDLERPRGLRQRYQALHRRHSLILLPAAIASLAIGLSLSAAMASPVPLVLSAGVSLGAIVLDRPYVHLSRLVEWYGLKGR
ncbi:MAG: hypothetical protein LLG21_04165 [Euryarchaeota archaeon]|nr:hypothetical protein [Euryarchaeota archaeon]